MDSGTAARAAWTALQAAHWAVSATLIILGLTATFLRSGRRVKHSVGFFHPFTSDGGGGERVLWCAIRAVQESNPEAETIVYTGDECTAVELAERASRRFGVLLPRPIGVVRLRWRALVLPEHYPVFTMVGQALGAAVLTAEALSQYRPDIFFDTVGHAFGYPLARLAGCRVAAYVHYPAISVDMISRVRSRASAFNNARVVARSSALSRLKVWYYRLFALAYGTCGRCADAVAVNSSWTESHVAALWGGKPRVVYPPCDVEALRRAPIRRPRSNVTAPGSPDERRDEGEGPETGTEGGFGSYVLSVGQFRPEKDHPLQLRAWARAREVATRANDRAVLDARLKIAGGCRGEADRARLDALRGLAADLRVDDSVDFHVDEPYSEIRRLLAGARAGLHTMLDEHFGICVVEYMASGAIPIAHDSAGPRMDIVVGEGPGREVGFLATSEEDFAAAIANALRMPDDERDEMATRARRRTERFGEETFRRGLRETLAPILEEMRARDRKVEALREKVAMERASRSPSPRKSTPRKSTPTRGAAPSPSPMKSPLASSSTPTRTPMTSPSPRRSPRIASSSPSRELKSRGLKPRGLDLKSPLKPKRA